MFLCLTFVFAALPIATAGDVGGNAGLRGVASGKADLQQGDVAGSPYLLPLHREQIPVRQNGKVVSFKTTYSGKISVGGGAGQEFSVVFDTGSGHVVVPSLTCDSATCLKHHRYNISKSPKALPVNSDGQKVPDDELCDQATIGYGTGSVTGEFVKESVCLGPAKPAADTRSLKSAAIATKEPVCTTMNMVVAVEMSAQPFESFKFDGIFGLGLDSLALSSDFSFFSSFSAQARSKQTASFGFFLSDGEHGEQSEIAVGGHNSDRLMGPLAWAPVASPKLGFWNIKIRSVRIGGVDVANCKKGGCKGILDTGTSHLGVPSHHIDSITDLLSQNVAGTTDCRSVAAPEVKIDVNGFIITLGPEDYMPASVDNPAIAAGDAVNENAVDVVSASNGLARREDPAAMRRCQPRVMPVNMQKPLGRNVFLLGEPVLHRYYTVYDWHKQRVGFGLANNNKNRIRGGTTASASAELKVESLDALEGEDEEIYMLQMSVTITMCEDAPSAAMLGSPSAPNTLLLA